MYWQHKQNENEFRAQMINKEMHHNRKGRENTNNQKKKEAKRLQNETREQWKLEKWEKWTWNPYGHCCIEWMMTQKEKTRRQSKRTKWYIYIYIYIYIQEMGNMNFGSTTIRLLYNLYKLATWLFFLIETIVFQIYDICLMMIVLYCHVKTLISF